ncbi:MAG: OmpH family outer membrane protein [Chitinophagales bacterium]|nr:OmpH family outer membrane protein [Chitinophagales bacterium]
MKNLSLLLNAVLLLAVGYLFYAQFSKPAAPAPIMPPASQSGGARIAFINADTLDAKYEWLKQQKEAIEQRMRNAENSLVSKQETLMKEADALQRRYAEGNMTQADAEKAQASLMQRGERLREEEARLSKSLAEEQKKAFNDLYANLETQLKQLSSQIGYDYILSYTRGGQILMANDSLDITKQVLDLLNSANAKKE